MAIDDDDDDDERSSPAALTPPVSIASNPLPPLSPEQTATLRAAARSQTEIDKDGNARTSTETGIDLFQGPIPPPHFLAQYDKVKKGFAKDIMEMAKAEQKHRHAIEKQAIALETDKLSAQVMIMSESARSHRWGLVAGSSMVITVMGISGYLVYLGATTAGIATLVGAIGIMAASVISRRIKRRKKKTDPPTEPSAPNDAEK